MATSCAVVVPVEELLARRLIHFALEEGDQVVAVEVDLERPASRLAALHAAADDVRIAACGREGGQQILVSEHLVVRRAGLDHARPTDRHRDAEGTLPVGGLLALERRAAAVGPAHHLGAVVGRVDDDRVVGDPELVELREQLPHVPVVLHHAVGIEPETCLPLRLGLQMREDVHPGAVEVQEPRRPGLGLLLHPAERGVRELVVHRLHAFPRERARCPRSCRLRRSGSRRAGRSAS